MISTNTIKGGTVDFATIGFAGGLSDIYTGGSTVPESNSLVSIMKNLL